MVRPSGLQQLLRELREGVPAPPCWPAGGGPLEQRRLRGLAQQRGQGPRYSNGRPDVQVQAVGEGTRDRLSVFQLHALWRHVPPRDVNVR